MKKVSVIVPIYNMEEYLEECLNSIISQSLLDIEILCLDDGSTDKSLKILQEYAKKDDRIVVVSQENIGVGATRNRGISLARGEYVAFLDPDDWYPEKDVLKILYEKAEENAALICGGSFSEYNNGIIKSHYDGEFAKYTFNEEKFIEYSDFQFDYGYVRFIYKRVFLVENCINFPNYLRFQDPPFLVKAMVFAKKFYAIPNIVYRYRKGHKVVNWDNRRVNDMVRGHIDNLKISKEYRLATLHYNTVQRLSKEYKKVILKNLSIENLELLELLIYANKIIDIDLLKEVDGTLNSYVLNELEVLFSSSQKEQTLTLKISKLEEDLKQIKDSRSYKLAQLLANTYRKLMILKRKA